MFGEWQQAFGSLLVWIQKDLGLTPCLLFSRLLASSIYVVCFLICEMGIQVPAPKICGKNEMGPLPCKYQISGPHSKSAGSFLPSLLPSSFPALVPLNQRLEGNPCVRAILYPTLCNPIDCSPPGSSVHGIVQARILEWVAIPSSRGSSGPRGQAPVSSASCTGRRILYH